MLVACYHDGESDITKGRAGAKEKDGMPPRRGVGRRRWDRVSRTGRIATNALGGRIQSYFSSSPHSNRLADLGTCDGSATARSVQDVVSTP